MRSCNCAGSWPWVIDIDLEERRGIRGELLLLGVVLVLELRKELVTGLRHGYAQHGG